MDGQHVYTQLFRVVASEGGDRYLLSLESYRNLIRDGQEAELSRYGGLTVSVVKNIFTHTYHIGIAVCNDTDMYDKDEGTRRSIDRANRALRKGRKFDKLPRGVPDSIKAGLDVVLINTAMRYILDDDTLTNTSFAEFFPFARRISDSDPVTA